MEGFILIANLSVTSQTERPVSIETGPSVSRLASKCSSVAPGLSEPLWSFLGWLLDAWERTEPITGSQH
jgi:hypothetical protein